MVACPAFNASGPYVSGMTAFVDCQARSLGEDGYAALGAGSSLGAALVGAITIYVAIIGYRIMLGDTPGVRHWIGSAVKIGFVLALATQWSAFRVVVYDVAIAGPGEIVGQLLAPQQLGTGDTADVASRVERLMQTLSIVPNASTAPAFNPNPSSTTTGSGDVTSQEQPSTIVNQTTRNAALIVLVTAIGGLMSVRLVAGLLLALAPIFIACALFKATRGLFEGWVRALIGAVLGAVAVGIILPIELTILESQAAALALSLDLSSVLQSRSIEMLATAILFAIMLIGSLIALARVAIGFRLPDDRTFRNPQPAADTTTRDRVGSSADGANAASIEERSRAQSVAAAALAQARRDQRIEIPAAARARFDQSVSGRVRDQDGVDVRGDRSVQRRTLGYRASRTATRRDAATKPVTS